MPWILRRGCGDSGEFGAVRGEFMGKVGRIVGEVGNTGGWQYGRLAVREVGNSHILSLFNYFQRV
jgi:hypothetical protein